MFSQAASLPKIISSDAKMQQNSKVPLTLQLKLLIQYCESLEAQIKQLQIHNEKLDYELDRDATAEAELKLINKNPKLQSYYLKLCELSYYFAASQALATSLVESRDDTHDMVTKGVSTVVKSVLHSIPIVSGLTGIIDGLETAAHLAHSVTKHRRAVNLAQWTRGLANERLAQRFARKLTILKLEEILNPNTGLDLSSQKGLLDKVIATATYMGTQVAQTVREFKENRPYTLQEKLALAHTLELLEAIATQKLKSVPGGTEHERLQAHLDAMLAYFKPPIPRIESLPQDYKKMGDGSLGIYLKSLVTIENYTLIKEILQNKPNILLVLCFTFEETILHQLLKHNPTNNLLIKELSIYAKEDFSKIINKNNLQYCTPIDLALKNNNTEILTFWVKNFAAKIEPVQLKKIRDYAEQTSLAKDLKELFNKPCRFSSTRLSLWSKESEYKTLDSLVALDLSIRDFFKLFKNILEKVQYLHGQCYTIHAALDLKHIVLVGEGVLLLKSSASYPLTIESEQKNLAVDVNSLGKILEVFCKSHPVWFENEKVKGKISKLLKDLTRDKPITLINAICQCDFLIKAVVEGLTTKPVR